MEDVDEIDIALAVEDHAAALREQSLMGMDAGGFVGVGKSTHHSYDYTLDAEMEAELELLASSEEASDFTGDGSLDEEQYYHSDPDCLFNDVDCLIKDEMSDPVEATSGSLEDVGALSESMQTPRLGSLSGSSESVGLEESSVGLEEPVGSEQSEQSVDSPHLSGSCDSGDVESGPATDPTGITTTESLFGDGSYLTSDFLERTRELEKGGLMQDAQSNLLALATLKAAADAMAAAAAAESISYPVPATTPTQPRPELSPSESSNVATPTPTSTSASTSTSPLVAAKSQLSSFRLPPGLMAPLSRKKEDGELQRKVYVHKACVNCKMSHVACDTSRPCQRCVRIGKEDQCVDAERKKRGRPCNTHRERKAFTPFPISETEDGDGYRQPKRHRPILPYVSPQTEAAAAYQRLLANAAAAAAATAAAAGAVPGQPSSEIPLSMSEEVYQAVAALSMLMPYASTAIAMPDVQPKAAEARDTPEGKDCKISLLVCNGQATTDRAEAVSQMNNPPPPSTPADANASNR